MNRKRLTELDPKFIKRDVYQGLRFDCPACPKPHKIRVWLQGPGQTWQKTGSTFDDLSLSPSIDGTPACKFHGNVANGEVTWP